MAESSTVAIIKIIGNSFYRKTALRATAIIVRRFFFLQLKAALLPGRVPVTGVDHALDKKIPFNPGKVEIYLDFLHFFIRILGFLMRYFKKPSLEVRDFIESAGALYNMAAQVYEKNLSTTNRPRYLSKFRFIVIHAFDPHLLCIPSLHVMMVIRTYTGLRAILKNHGDDGRYKNEIEQARSHAIAIAEAVLYIKQHSVNCISAAMYAMSRYNDLFPQSEAECFANDLFRNAAGISADDAGEIRTHIITLYRQFLERGSGSLAWEKPLLDFLASFPVTM